MSFPPLSPGIARGCFEVLELVDRFQVTARELAIQFPTVFVVATEVAVGTCLQLGWVQIGTDHRLTITDKGRQVILEQDPIKRLRMAIATYVFKVQPPWLAAARFGRRRVVSYVDRPMVQLMSEAGLISNVDPDTVAFWDSLAGLSQGDREQQLMEIGREGERLTMDYERRRTGSEPIWISLEDNYDGYDVLSIVERNSLIPLAIEVKATSQKSGGHFFLTRNEWRRACESLHHHFHLWRAHMTPPLLAIVTPEKLEKHIPDDKGNGEWTEAIVPFELFDFRSVQSTPTTC